MAKNKNVISTLPPGVSEPIGVRRTIRSLRERKQHTAADILEGQLNAAVHKKGE